MSFLPRELPEWLVPDGPDAVRVAAGRFRAAERIAILAMMPEGVDHARRRRREIAHALVAAITGTESRLLRIETGPYGAPVILPAALGLHVSFSARDGLAIIGVATRRIGVDIESEPDAGAIPWNILRPDERAAIRALPAPAQPAAFARLWVLKEAFLKAAATGLLAPPETVQLARDLDGGDIVSGPDPAQAGGNARIPAFRTICDVNGGHARHVALILLS